MSFSLDTPSVQTLKSEAKALRDERAASTQPISLGTALEETARRHGYRDWNTASAALPERVGAPVQVGDRVSGTYLSRRFKGMVLGVHLLADMQHYEGTVKFDQPVNVSKFASMQHLRQRVKATVDVYGVSVSRTSDGEPHMRVKRGS
jgi:hypothetical protein